MVGVIDLFSGGNVAQGLFRASNIATTPNFELQFNTLQNTLIGRLNEKIAEAQADDGLVNGKIDAFLAQAAMKLSATQQGLEIFIFENYRNINGVSAIASKLDELDSALSASDTAAFNTTLGKLNETIGFLKVTDGSAIGIYSTDGIQKLRYNGVVRYDDDGTPTKATALSDFADTSAASSAITAARAEVGNIASALVLKTSGAEDLRVRTASNLNSTLMQIKAAQVADQASQADEIAKLKDEYAQLLNVVSLAFESSKTLTEQLGNKLFEEPALENGSVLNLFI